MKSHQGLSLLGSNFFNPGVESFDVRYNDILLLDRCEVLDKDVFYVDEQHLHRGITLL